MIRAIWFCLKLALLVFVAGWLARQNGAVSMEWNGYLIETSAGFLAAVLIVAFVVYAIFYRIWRAFVSVPAALRRYDAIRTREKGYRDITAGLVAVAAGDSNAAEKYAKSAQKRLPDAPLAALLRAQSFKLKGDDAKARQIFSGLLEEKEVAFLGVRGLLQDALHQGNHAEALAYIRKASVMQPKQGWVMRTLFELEARHHNWNAAENALKKATKLKVFTSDEMRRHKQALFLARAEDSFNAGDVVAAYKLAAKSFHLNTAFTPAGIFLARYYMHVGKTRSAIKTLESAWRKNPHPELASLWLDVKPHSKKSLSVYDKGKDAYAWVQRLSALNPEHHESLRALGTAAMDAGHYREARSLLTKAADFRALTVLERRETGDDAKVRSWMEAALDAPPEPKWICQSCGHAALDWQSVCRSCGVFNDAIWDTLPVFSGHTDIGARALPHSSDILNMPPD